MGLGMQIDVYADVLFLINFSMDYLCLYITARVLHRKMTLWRILSASALGGIYAQQRTWIHFAEDTVACR